MGSPVVIGSYCSDFTVTNPTGASDFCFYKSTVGDYYLASNSAMKNTASAFAAGQDDDIKIIPKSFYRPTYGSITAASGTNTLDWFTEFKFKPIWVPTISGDFSSTPVIPADERRFLSSTLHPTISTTEPNRFVKLESKTNNSGGFKFVGSAVADYAKFRPQTGVTRNTAGLADSTISGLIFTPTHESPIVSTSSIKGVYIVLKSDWDKRTEAVTAAKRLRYLVYDPVASAFRLVDLYDPDISENIVKSCFYRITNGEYVTLDQSTITDSTTFSSATQTSTWGIKAYVSSTNPGLFLSSTALSIPSLTSDTDPTSGTTVTDLNLAFFNNSNGTNTIGDFTSSTGSASSLDSSSYINDGFEGSYITKNVNYIDHTDGYVNTFNASAARTLETFVFVTQVFDKRVEELFTNVNVTLLRLVQTSSGVPATSPAAGDTNNYLGLEHIIPANSVTVDNGATGTVNSVTDVFTPTATTTSGNGIGLIVRDYFKFFNPARATQFKFYDLGNNGEYLWQANFQSGAANAYAYITVSTANKLEYRTKISDQNQRGWILEYDNTMTPPGVRLKWAKTGRYLDLVRHGTASPDNVAEYSPERKFGTDSAPLKADGVTFEANRANAAVFNCIVCSSIDASGACMPITTGAFTGGIGVNARSTPLNAAAISSPVSPLSLNADSKPFRLKNRDGYYVKYVLSQFESGRSPVILGALDTSPSPIPSDPYISEFILTQRGGTMSDVTRAKNAFFIKAADMTDGNNYYLRTDPNTGSVRMVASNNPSEQEGYSWILTNNNLQSARYNLISVPVTGAATFSTSGRFLGLTGNDFIPTRPTDTETNTIFSYENKDSTVSYLQDFLAFRNTTANWAPQNSI